MDRNSSGRVVPGFHLIFFPPHSSINNSSVKRVPFKRGGGTQAKALLARFLRDRLSGYAKHRKEADRRHQSFLSPYLHFGHISALYVALKVRVR